LEEGEAVDFADIVANFGSDGAGGDRFELHRPS
jgi:hypothetical protein